MANVAAAQSLNVFSALLDTASNPQLLGAATDGQLGPQSVALAAPQFQCQAASTVVAADTVTATFSGATVAGLNLAAGESRTLMARIRGSGALASAVVNAYTEFGVINLAGTLTATALTTIVYGATGHVAPTVVWSIAAGVPQLVVTMGAGITASNVVIDLFLIPNGKGK